MDVPTGEAADAPLDKPSVARMYDYYLGGFHNFAIDRQAADTVATLHPDVALVMRANRAFLRRAVHFLIVQGIDQFLDIGSGIPTVGNVHEVAQRENPAARVVYVDSDPVAVAHSAAILQGNDAAAIVQADARRPEQILSDPVVRRMLDFDRPLGVLIVALLHFIPDDGEAYGLVRAVRDAVAPGSYLVIGHGTMEGLPPERYAQMERLYAQTTNPGRFRSRAAVERFFEELTVLEPGIVHVPLWRPEGADDLFPPSTRTVHQLRRCRLQTVGVAFPHLLLTHWQGPLCIASTIFLI